MTSTVPTEGETMATYARLAEIARDHGNAAVATPAGAAVDVVWMLPDGSAEVETVVVRTLAELLAVLGY